MKPNNAVTLNGWIVLEKQNIATIQRVNEHGRKVTEQTPVAECLMRTGQTAPLSLDSKHRILLYGERAFEMLAFADVSQHENLNCSVYGWLRTNRESGAVRSIVVTDTIIFHVSAGLRVAVAARLAAIRMGMAVDNQRHREHFASRMSNSGFRANSVLMDGMFSLRTSQVAQLGKSWNTHLIMGVIQTGADTSTNLHSIAAYGKLAQEISSFVEEAGPTFEATVQGWLRNRWQDDTLLASDVVAEQVIFHE